MSTIAKLIAAIFYVVYGLIVLVGGIVVFAVAAPLGFAILVVSIVLYILGVGTIIVGTRRH